MKHYLLPFFLLFSSFVFSQNTKKLHHIKPKWKLGDVRRVHSETFTKIFLKDSLINHTEASTNYNIKIIDTIKNYTILYSSVPDSFEITSNSSDVKVDSALTIFTDIVKRIEKETKLFQYELVVDKNTGQALRIKNGDKLLKLIEKNVISVAQKLSENLAKSSSQVDLIKEKVMSNFKQREAKMLETILNEFNYIMGAYALKFPYNSSISEKAMIHDVNAMGDFGTVEIPGVVTTSSKKSNTNLIVQTSTDYDKVFLLEQIKKKYKDMKDLTVSDIFLSENTETSFTNVSNWVVSQESNVTFKTKEIKVVNQTLITFQ